MLHQSTGRALAQALTATALAATALCLPAQAQAATIAERFGVNVHMDAKNTHYLNVADTYDKAVWIGATHLRAQAPASNDTYTLNAMLAACDRGLSWTVIVMRDPEKYWAGIRKIAARKGCLHALEGPNEVNVTPPVYGTLRGYAAGVAIQKALYAKANADPLAVDVPVYSLTVSVGGATAALGNLSAYSDFATSHPYMSQGYPPSCCMMTMAKAALAFAPGRPMVISETGYRSMLNTSNAVDSVTQDRLMLDTLYDALLAGVSDVTMYQLLDALPDPSNTGMESHWGFFNGTYNPESIKPVGYGFHYTMGLLGASTVTGSVATLQKAPRQTRMLTSRDADGTTYVSVWPEPTLWNNVTHTRNAIATTTATLSLGGTYTSVKVYNVVATGPAPAATYSNVSSITLPISADPLIVALHKDVVVAAAGQ